MSESKIMRVALLRKILAEIEHKFRGDLEVWLSSDEEGNEFLPMSETVEYSLEIDEEGKRIVLFPLHR